MTTLNNKGISVYYLDKYNQSIFYFDKALSIDPNDIDALYYKGGAFDKLGNYNQAIIFMNKAIVLLDKA